LGIFYLVSLGEPWCPWWFHSPLRCGQEFTHPRGDAVVCHDESCWHHIPAGFQSREHLGLPPIGGRTSHGHGPESLKRHLHGAHA
jgi:hypothetical protein